MERDTEIILEKFLADREYSWGISGTIPQSIPIDISEEIIRKIS